MSGTYGVRTGAAGNAGGYSSVEGYAGGNSSGNAAPYWGVAAVAAQEPQANGTSTTGGNGGIGKEST